LGKSVSWSRQLANSRLTSQFIAGAICDLSVDSCQFLAIHSGDVQGAAILSPGRLSVVRSSFTFCYSSKYGGAIACSNSLYCTATSFENCHSPNAAAIFADPIRPHQSIIHF
jgi:hypothetical protein